MTKLIWYHVLAVSAWTLKIAHISSYQEAQTIPDCIRYITVYFAITLNHRPKTFFLLACVKAEI